MIAKGGHALIERDAVDTIKYELLPRAGVLTPNVSEAEVLTGLVIMNLEDMKKAAEILQKMGAKSVLLKRPHERRSDL